MESKSGNTFFIIIDRVGEEENVYFLNMVDEADLTALIEQDEAEKAPEVCTCKDRCYPGHVDTTCPVCATNMAECVGAEPEPEEPAEEPDEETPEKKGTAAAGAALILLLALGGGAAYYFLKVKGKTKPDTKGDVDLDDYDYGEDDEDYTEFEPYDQDVESGDGEEIESDAPPDLPAPDPEDES